MEASQTRTLREEATPSVTEQVIARLVEHDFNVIDACRAVADDLGIPLDRVLDDYYAEQRRSDDWGISIDMAAVLWRLRFDFDRPLYYVKQESYPTSPVGEIISLRTDDDYVVEVRIDQAGLLSARGEFESPHVSWRDWTPSWLVGTVQQYEYLLPEPHQYLKTELVSQDIAIRVYFPGEGESSAVMQFTPDLPGFASRVGTELRPTGRHRRT